jgi:2-aminoadipate transaminase
MHNVRRSFIREILKVTERPEIISFAGGLPNPKLFPVQEIADAAFKVLHQKGESVLQYSTTEGYLPLREYIAKRYLKRHRLEIDPDEILITNGSQQGLDLIAKVFLDRGEQVVIERPGYLGAIQAFSLYEPEFQAIELFEDGIDTEALERILEKKQVKLFYAVPNFQNPSGISYSEQIRQDVAHLLKSHTAILVEDDPYGELRFIGKDLPTMRNYLGNRVLLLGSFSKIVSPGLRLGWICGQKAAMEKLIIAKQASDLHSNHLSQRIVHQYLLDNDLDCHILKIRKVYKEQRDVMVSMIEKYFPQETNHTRPEGGMFLWITLPQGISSLELFEQATQLNVAFVPGQPFYVDGGGENTLRLNFSNTDEVQIEEGIKRLAEAMKKLMA